MKRLKYPFKYTEWLKLPRTKKAIKIIMDDLYPKPKQLKLNLK
jgi:hypothetical protein